MTIHTKGSEGSSGSRGAYVSTDDRGAVAIDRASDIKSWLARDGVAPTSGSEDAVSTDGSPARTMAGALLSIRRAGLNATSGTCDDGPDGAIGAKPVWIGADKADRTRPKDGTANPRARITVMVAPGRPTPHRRCGAAMDSRSNLSHVLHAALSASSYARPSRCAHSVQRSPKPVSSVSRGAPGSAQSRYAPPQRRHSCHENGSVAMTRIVARRPLIVRDVF
jgi:hypothetical protein